MTYIQGLGRYISFLGRRLVDRKLVEAPSGFVAGRPGAALLFWFFGGFGCGVPLLIAILVVRWYKNR